MRAAAYAARHLRWNFGILLIDGVAFFVGLAFFDPNTIMPVLLKGLGAEDWQVGFARFIQVMGFALPSLFASHYIHGRAEHRSFLITACAIGRIPLLTIPAVLIWLGVGYPALALVWILAVYSIFWLLDGGAAVSWFDIVGKTMPARVRGRFFGVLQSATGLAAVGAGALAAVILGSRSLDFPFDFALLAGLWCAGALISQASLYLIREPRGDVDDVERPGIREYLRSAIPMLRRNPRLSRLIASRLLLDGGALAAPFYVLFARENLAVPLETVGLYTASISAGKVVTGPIWGWISDRHGPVYGFRAVALSTAVVPGLALLSAAGAPGLLLAAFFLLGAVQDGLWMTGSNVMLESVDDRDRPLVIGVSSLFQAPGSLYGILGGLIAQAFSYPVVFAGALAVTLAGFGAALRIGSTAPAEKR